MERRWETRRRCRGGACSGVATLSLPGSCSSAAAAVIRSEGSTCPGEIGARSATVGPLSSSVAVTTAATSSLTTGGGGATAAAAAARAAAPRAFFGGGGPSTMSVTALYKWTLSVFDDDRE